MHEAVITLLKSLVTFYPNPGNRVGVLIAEAFWRFFSRSEIDSLAHHVRRVLACAALALGAERRVPD